MALIEAVQNLAVNPYDTQAMLDLAEEYFAINQTASAASLYLRAAEYSEPQSLLTYSALIRLSQCFAQQGSRIHSAINSLLQAVAECPTRPEAYLQLSMLMERERRWQESYSWAEIGITMPQPTEPLPVSVGYFGQYCLGFQKAVAAWWIGRKEESLQLFNLLDTFTDIHPTYIAAVRSNLALLEFQ
jgi:tetratricopeptide (TPR) repeat protein